MIRSWNVTRISVVFMLGVRNWDSLVLLICGGLSNG